MVDNFYKIAHFILHYKTFDTSHNSFRKMYLNEVIKLYGLFEIIVSTNIYNSWVVEKSTGKDGNLIKKFKCLLGLATMDSM